VVYKVDRSQSIAADFAKVMEVFPTSTGVFVRLSVYPASSIRANSSGPVLTRNMPTFVRAGRCEPRISVERIRDKACGAVQTRPMDWRVSRRLVLVTLIAKRSERPRLVVDVGERTSGGRIFFAVSETGQGIRHRCRKNSNVVAGASVWQTKKRERAKGRPGRSDKCCRCTRC